MNSKVKKVIEVILAALMVIFGLNKFFGFIPVDPPSDPTAQQFMGVMFSTYLFKVVAIAEILGGILLIIPKTTLVGWLILLPVMFNIVAFHIAHDFIGNGLWLLPTVLFLAVGFFLKDKLYILQDSTK